MVQHRAISDPYTTINKMSLLDKSQSDSGLFYLLAHELPALAGHSSQFCSICDVTFELQLVNTKIKDEDFHHYQCQSI